MFIVMGVFVGERRGDVVRLDGWGDWEIDGVRVDEIGRWCEGGWRERWCVWMDWERWCDKRHRKPARGIDRKVNYSLHSQPPHKLPS